MGKPFSQAGGRNPELLITTINQAWNKAGKPEGTVYQDIAFVDDSGIGGKGSELAQYPIRVLSQRPVKKGDTVLITYTVAPTVVLV